MPKIPARLIKGLMKKLGSNVTDEMNTKHEDIIKAMRAKQVPKTAEIEQYMTKPVMTDAPAVPQAAVAEGDIRPEIAGMSKSQAKTFIEGYKNTAQPDNPFRSPEGTIGPSSQELRDAERLRLQRGGKPQVQEKAVELPEDESDSIDSIMKLMKEAKAKKK